MSPNGAAGALVTGGARGIGLAIVEALAGRGDHVTIADVDADEARRAAATLESRGLAVRGVALDVTNVAQVHRVVAEADEVTPLGTVVCNAGIGIARSFVDTTEAEFDAVTGVNYKGVFFTIQAALTVMIPRRRGSIVAISSTSGFASSSFPEAVYDASKAAVRMLAMAAAREVSPAGVRVNAVAPGTVATDMVKRMLGEEGMARVAGERIPMGRLAYPQEIAAAAAFLSSDAASYITGHTLVVDGGWLT